MNHIWVSYGTREHPKIWCENCKACRYFVLPVALDMFISECTIFQRLHRKCKRQKPPQSGKWVDLRWIYD